MARDPDAASGARRTSSEHADPVYDGRRHRPPQAPARGARRRPGARGSPSSGIEPLEIGYEAFSAEPHATVCRVLEHLSLPTDVPIPDPPMRRQSDGLSAEWAERYREEVPA